MHEGQTARVTAVTATTITVECGGVHAYTLGPASAAHARHAELKIGDVLVAVNDSAATGDTLVRMTPCGCTRLLHAE